MHGSLLDDTVTPTGGTATGLRRPTRAWSFGVALLALAAAVAVYHELWADPFHSTLGRHHHSNDPMQTMWNLHWVPWSLLHGHNPFRTMAIYFPTGVSLSWNTLTPTLGLLAAPLTLTAGAAFSYSVLVTLAPALFTVTTFWWLRRHVQRPAAAALAAFAAGFGPYVTGHLQGHLDLTFVALIPLILMRLEDLLWRHPRSARRSSVALGLLTAAQAGINEELVLITAIAVCLVAACWAVAEPRATLAAARAAVRPLLMAAGVFAVAAAPLLVDQLFLSPSVALHSGQWRATFGDYLWPLQGQVVRLGPDHHSLLGGAEDGVYLGPAMLAVLAVGLVTTWRVRAVRAAAVTLGVLVVLTFGATHPLGIPMPWNALGRLPVLTSVLPGRFAFASTLVVAWLIAYWLDRLGARRRTVTALGTAAIAVALLAWVPRPIGTSPLPSTPSALTPGHLGLPSGAVVLLLPSPTPGDASGMYVQQAAGFWFRMPGGYALHRVPGGVADAPQTSPLVRLAAAGPAATADDLAAGRAQLAQQHYRAIVVLTRLPDAGSATSLATALTGRPANRVLGGVAVWTLPG